jgi:hypothetical protein
MKTNAALFLLLAIAFSCCLAGAEETGNTPASRHMTLREAVQWAPKHNHDIRIASYTVKVPRRPHCWINRVPGLILVENETV